jgi:hypothetical protein
MTATQFIIAMAACVLVGVTVSFTGRRVMFKEACTGPGVCTHGLPPSVTRLACVLPQGLILAYLRPLFKHAGPPLPSGLRYGPLMIVYLWIVSVLAYAARTNISSFTTVFTPSSAVHLIQFGVYGTVLDWIATTGESQ